MFDTADAESSLSGISVLVNFAGPFARTAEPLMRACIKAGIDYLDITAEINVYRLAETLGAEAAANQVMLLPGVGWDVVPTDSLAVHVAKRVKACTCISRVMRFTKVIYRDCLMARHRRRGMLIGPGQWLR